MRPELVSVLVTCALGAACLDPAGANQTVRIPPGLVPPASDGCPSTPLPFASCLEPGAYAFGVEPPVYRTPAAALPPGTRNEWDYLEAGTYGVSVPLDDGSNIAWYVGRDTAQNTRIGVATTPDYATWTKVAVSGDSAEANVVMAPTTRCDGGGFVGGFGIARLPGGSFVALVSARAVALPHRRSAFDWCLHTSADGVHWALDPASPVYTLGVAGAPDDYITEVRALLALGGGYLVLAQIVNEREAPSRRVALYFSANLVTWHLANVLSSAWQAGSQDHGAVFVTVPGYADPLLVWERLDSRTTATSLYLARLVMSDSDVTADLFPEAVLQPSPGSLWDSGQLFAWTQQLVVVDGWWRMVYGAGQGTYNTAVLPRGAGYADWVAGELGFVTSAHQDTITVVTKPYRWGGRTPNLPSRLFVETSSGGNATLAVWCQGDTAALRSSFGPGAGTFVVDSAVVQRLETCPDPPYGRLTVALPAGGRLYGWRQSGP